MAPRLDVPSTVDALAWLRSLDDPVVGFGLAARIDEAPEEALGQLGARVWEVPQVVAAFSVQRRDGSWGDHDDSTRRILPTLKMVATLADLGAGQHRGWSDAVDFLAANAHSTDGVFAVDGRTDGVLSCYVGLAASAYLAGGRLDLAEAQVRWVVRYQEVRRAGAQMRTGGELWGGYLRSRYGGCMADTTCLVGLAKVGRALGQWAELHDDSDVHELVEAVREAFLARRLMYAGDGSVLPLGVAPRHGERWLEPTFPLDWHTDLVEIVDFVASTGPPDIRVQPALDVLARMQLPDGTWPLLQTQRPEHLPLLERRTRNRGSPIATLRIVAALHRLTRAAR